MLEKINWKGLLGLLLIFILATPACHAQENGAFADRFDTEKFSHKLDKEIQKATDGQFACQPEVTAFEYLGKVEDGISKYQMEITVGEGEFDKLYLCILVRDDLTADNYRGVFDILTGQYLSGRGGFYSAPYSDIDGARKGWIVITADRREAAITSSDVDANNIMSKWGVKSTIEDYFIEIAASKLLASELTGIKVDDIEVTALGHSQGATFLAFYCWEKYQDTSIGQVKYPIWVETIIHYNDGVGNELLKQGQASNYKLFVEKYNSGSCAASSMNDFLLLAEKVVAGDEKALSDFKKAYSMTYAVKLLFGEYPYTADYHYGPADTDMVAVANKMISGAVVPYSPMENDAYMSGLMGEVVPAGTMDNFEEGLLVGCQGGCGNAGSDWFTEHGNVEYYEGGDSGHMFMMNKDSESNWQKIWAFADSHAASN